MNNNTYPFYLTIEEYAGAIHNAHLEYLKTTHRPLNGVNTHHVSDLASSSTAFFESAYLVLDNFSSLLHHKVDQEFIKNSQPEADIEIDEPRWHRPKKSKKSE